MDEATRISQVLPRWPDQRGLVYSVIEFPLLRQVRSGAPHQHTDPGDGMDDRGRRSSAPAGPADYQAAICAGLSAEGDELAAQQTTAAE